MLLETAKITAAKFVERRLTGLYAVHRPGQRHCKFNSIKRFVVYTTVFLHFIRLGSSKLKHQS